MRKIGIAAAAMIACIAPSAMAHETVSAPPIISSGDTTIVYVFPTSPQAFVPVAGLPSFLVMPGADVPPVATQVIYSKPLPVSSTQMVMGVKVDCSNFSGTVVIAGEDVFGLDRNGNGIGCEPEDR